MRYFSTDESIIEREMSVLALIETVLAMSFSIFIAIKYRVVAHIVFGISIAPFLLLRTDMSTKLGVSWFKKMFSFENKIINKIPVKGTNLFSGIILFLLILILAAVSALFVRVVATIVTLLKYPVESITSIPLNWFTIALVMDMKHPPELLPGLNRYGDDAELRFVTWPWFSGLFKEILKGPPDNRETAIRETIQLSFVSFLFYGFLYFPALIYRFSLKATSLIYLPFIWIIGTGKSKDNNLKLVLDDIMKSQVERIKRLYAVFVIIFLTIIPFTTSFYWEKISANWQGKSFIKYFFLIDEIDSWHITRFGSCIITFLLFYFADKISIRVNHYNISRSEIIKLFFSMGFRIRTIMTLWTIGCGIHILYSSVDWSTFPKIRWLP